MTTKLNHVMLKEVEKVKKYIFKLCTHSDLHINTHVLTSHDGTIIEL